MQSLKGRSVSPWIHSLFSRKDGRMAEARHRHVQIFKWKTSSSQQGQKAILPKPEMLDFDFPEDALYSPHAGDNAASSSRSNVRSFFIGMGFLPSLVEKVIQEKGEDNADLLLETLIEYSASNKKLCSILSDFLLTTLREEFLKENLYIVTIQYSLFMEKNEADFAMEKLGEDAPVNELVDFIAAA
ncbi:hypothetical protein CRYUN_Cryun36dG0108000 [Craigia yunnanensis]